MPDTSGAVELGQAQPSPEPPQAPEPQPKKARDLTQDELITIARDNFPGLPSARLKDVRQVLMLREQNMADEAMLARTHQAGIPPQEAARIQQMITMEMLWDMVFPPGTPEGAQARLEREGRYQKFLSQQWDAIASQVMQAKLTQGTQVDPALLEREMRRQAQQLPPGLRPGG
jgi:hypothetical protein